MFSKWPLFAPMQFKFHVIFIQSTKISWTTPKVCEVKQKPLKEKDLMSLLDIIRIWWTPQNCSCIILLVLVFWISTESYWKTYCWLPICCSDQTFNHLSHETQKCSQDINFFFLYFSQLLSDVFFHY